MASAGMDLRTGSVVQFTAAGLATALLALLFEDTRVAWTAEFVFALFWLVLVLSLGAVSLLYVLIRRGAAARVASLFFLVPPCTALMAWPLFGEPLGPVALIGMALTAMGWRWRLGRRPDSGHGCNDRFGSSLCENTLNCRLLVCCTGWIGMKRFVEGEKRQQTTLFPTSADDYVTEENPVRAIEAFVDTLDLAALGFASVVPETTGRPAYLPATLLKIYLCGYLNRS